MLVNLLRAKSERSDNETTKEKGSLPQRNRPRQK